MRDTNDTTTATGHHLLAELDAAARRERLTDPHEPIETRDHAALERLYPHPQRIVVALQLATDPDTCRALLNGDPIDPARLDQGELRRARDRALVRLDFHAIDLLTGQAAA